MQARRLQQLACEAVADAKGREVTVLDVRRIADFTDYMVIVTGTSNTHVLAVMDKVLERLREHGVKPIGVEGADIGDWVLLDFGDVVVHVMRAPTRDFYNLEKLWSEGKRIELAAK